VKSGYLRTEDLQLALDGIIHEESDAPGATVAQSVYGHVLAERNAFKNKLLLICDKMNEQFRDNGLPANTTPDNIHHRFKDVLSLAPETRKTANAGVTPYS